MKNSIVWGVATWEATLKRWKREDLLVSGREVAPFLLGYQDMKTNIVPNAGSVSLGNSSGAMWGPPLDPFSSGRFPEGWHTINARTVPWPVATELLGRKLTDQDFLLGMNCLTLYGGPRTVLSFFEVWQGSFVLSEYGYERNPALELKIPSHEFMSPGSTRAEPHGVGCFLHRESFMVLRTHGDPGGFQRKTRKV